MRCCCDPATADLEALSIAEAGKGATRGFTELSASG